MNHVGEYIHTSGSTPIRRHAMMVRGEERISDISMTRNRADSLKFWQSWGTLPVFPCYKLHMNAVMKERYLASALRVC